MKKIATRITAAAALLTLVGCAAITPQASHSTRAQYLNEVWVAPDIRGKAPSELYGHVYFAPTGTTRLKEQGWWASQSAKTAAELATDARKLANHLHRSLVSSSANYQGRRMNVVAHPGADTLVVETAITELVPSKAFWNAAATAAGFAVPGAGMLGAAGKGAITVEGRLLDGATGAVLARFRHRMTDPTAALNVASYQWYGGSESNLSEFAAKTAQMLNAPSNQVITRTSPFKLVAF